MDENKPHNPLMDDSYDKDKTDVKSTTEDTGAKDSTSKLDVADKLDDSSSNVKEATVVEVPKPQSDANKSISVNGVQAPAPGAPVDSTPVTVPGVGESKVLPITGLALSLTGLIGLIVSVVAFKKSKPGTTNKTLSIVGISLAAVFTLAWAWILLVFSLAAYNAITLSARADAFLTALQAQDYEKAMSYTEDPKDSGAREFLVNASSSLGKSHKLLDSNMFNEGKRKDNVRASFVYSLTGGDSSYARVSLATKEKVGAVVVELTHGSNKLKAEPGSGVSSLGSELDANGADDSSNKTKTTKVAAKPSTKAVADTCQNRYDNVPDEYLFISLSALSWDDPAYDEVKKADEDVKRGYFAGGPMTFFAKDLLDYEYPDVTSNDMDDFAAYLKTLTPGTYEIELWGMVGVTRGTSTSNAFSLKRTQKIKDELVSRGISASAISQYVSTRNDVNLNDNDPDGIQRRVDIFARNNC